MSGAGNPLGYDYRDPRHVERYGKLVVRNPDGSTEGKHPRDADVDVMREIREPGPLLRVIRAKCIDCSSGSESEVRKCTAIGCALWPYREVYLRDKCKWLTLDTDRLARSIFMRIANNEQLGAAFRLWLLAWGEKPAGSLPNDDRWLSDAAKIDRQRWSREADVVLDGFIACHDGRLYHPVICEIAKRRFEQLRGRQRGAALSRQRQQAKRENRRKNARRLAASLAAVAADDVPPF